MKKILALLVAIGLVVAAVTCLHNKINSDSRVTINVYNWGEFISDGYDGSLDVNKEFTNQTGINVNYNTFQNNESLLAKIKNGGANYDVIIPSDYMVSKLIEYDMLEKLDFNELPNASYIDENFKKPVYDPKNEYSVPYVWGTVGIVYNQKVVKEKEENISWEILWDEEYKGKILMFDNPRDAFSISQLVLGLSVNDTDESSWQKAADKLKNQKPLVQSYVMDQIFDKMGNEEAALAPYYTGDAVNLLQKNSNLRLVIPKEGTCKFIDAMCIPKNAEHYKEALQYINFMCEPRIAKANADRTGYSSPEAVVRDFQTLPNEQMSLNNAGFNENVETQTFKSLPDDLNKKIEEMWVAVKVGEEGELADLLLIICAFLSVYLLIALRKKLYKKITQR